MYKLFKETLDKIEIFQEDCARLTFGVMSLIGEDTINETSISDIAVSKTGLCPIQKKKISEGD